jgi:hypothetical protein
MMMKAEAPLLLDLDPRNLAHFLSALALAALAERLEGAGQESRRCWWEDNEHFAIQSEYPAEHFRTLLYGKAFEFLKALKWVAGIGGAAQGIMVSGSEFGVNPFVALNGDASETTPLKGFSARVIPGATLPQQIEKLKSPTSTEDWLNQLGRGVSNWGFDCRVNAHASDAGISSDAENTSDRDPFCPAVELLSLAAAAFFAPCHAWQVTKRTLIVSAWTCPILLSAASCAATGRIRGLGAHSYTFTWRGAAHGKGGAYHFFPPAKLTESAPPQL